jgi:predicted HicB family RNase H-like nuclease
MTYKGYEAVVELDEEAGVFHGEVINTRDVITFQGTSVPELKKAFEDSVEDYIEFCRQRKEEPEKPFSGSFVVRISPDLHRHIALEAKRKGKSLNAYVTERLKPHTMKAGSKQAD